MVSSLGRFTEYITVEIHINVGALCLFQNGIRIHVNSYFVIIPSDSKIDQMIQNMLRVHPMFTLSQYTTWANMLNGSNIL